jgi:hypothetical protein
MNVITRRFRGFERRYIRPLLQRLKGRRQQSSSTERSGEYDRLEELAVGLVRAELRRRRASPDPDSTALDAGVLDAGVLGAGGGPRDELTGLLKALLDTEQPPTA